MACKKGGISSHIHNRPKGTVTSPPPHKITYIHYKLLTALLFLTSRLTFLPLCIDASSLIPPPLLPQLLRAYFTIDDYSPGLIQISSVGYRA